MARITLDQQILVDYWLDKAEAAVNEAGSLLTGGEKEAALRRLYYAMFYILTADATWRADYYLRQPTNQTAFQQDFVETGIISDKFAGLFEKIGTRWHLDQQVLAMDGNVVFGYLAEAGQLLIILRKQFSREQDGMQKWSRQDW